MSYLPWHASAFEQLLAGRAGLGHALLVHGPRGIGKLAFTEALALALLCEGAAGLQGACGSCPACGWFAAGNHPDFRRVEPQKEEAAPDASAEQQTEKRGSTEITVGQVRALADFINASSHRGGAKVILIHPAEALNLSAANALLKSLEEPPADTIFLLVAHRPAYLPATVRSRCRQVCLGRPDAEGAAAWLKAEGITDPVLALAHTGNAPLLARELAQADYWHRRSDFLTRLADPDFDALATAEHVRDFEVEEIVAWLQKWTHDILLQHHAGSVRYNPDFAAPLASLASRVNALTLSRYHREIVRFQRVVEHPLNARLLFEKLFIDYQRSIAPAAHSTREAA
jgi:DNA polymerase-3 subunit delta'